MVPTTEVAMALGPSLMTVFIVFGGYYVNAENTPIIFHWIPRVSLIRWQPYNYIFAGTFRAFQGLCINEFSGLQFDHQHSFDLQTGEQPLVVAGYFFGASTGLLEVYMMRKLLKEKMKKNNMEETRDDDEIKEINVHHQVMKDSTSSTGYIWDSQEDPSHHHDAATTIP
ncbi:hypothetical protein U1Q18_043890 [Sarracenia purpurea var. burkii]